jgi:hypothetical protein
MPHYEEFKRNFMEKFKFSRYVLTSLRKLENKSGNEFGIEIEKAPGTDVLLM